MTTIQRSRSNARSKLRPSAIEGQALPVVDADLCKACGRCAEICPLAIPEVRQGRLTIRTDRPLPCLTCGQCVAVCSKGAMSHPTIPEERLPPAPELPFGADELHSFLLSRRSVRRFRDEPVDRATVERILEIASTAPMGPGVHTTSAIVVDGKRTLDTLKDGLHDQYGKLRRGIENPIGRFVIRRKVGPELFHVLEEHVVPVAEIAAELRAEGRDKLLYDGPTLIMLHGDPLATAAETNAHIVGTYVLLAAHALGLGATWLDIVTPVVNRRPDLQQLVGLPDGHRLFVSVILGHPKVRYRRAIVRSLRSVTFLDESQ